MKRIYFDYVASTPVHPGVMRRMRPYFAARFGNPSSLHREGQEAHAAVEESREAIARAVGADFREIIFTGSATEANNLALRGAVRRFKNYDLRSKNNSSDGLINPRIIISAIEHESVLETARDLEQNGIEVVYLPVNREGMVDLDALRRALCRDTVLVSIMYANNETGTIQPIAEIAGIIRDFKEERGRRKEKGKKHFPFSIFHFPLFHTDAVQALQFLDCDAKELGVDMMTLSSHKIYGPKGAGALALGGRKLNIENRGDETLKRTPLNSQSSILNPIITGGGQEFGLRAGTENVPAVVGFGEAVRLLGSPTQRKKEAARIRRLKLRSFMGLKKAFPRREVNGPTPDSPRTLPNILNVHFPGLASDLLLTALDRAGIAASAGSACATRAPSPSHVPLAMGISHARTRESIRFSFGRPTTKGEIDSALRRIKIIAEKLA